MVGSALEPCWTIVDTAALKENTPSLLVSAHYSLTKLSRTGVPWYSSPEYFLLALPLRTCSRVATDAG